MAARRQRLTPSPAPAAGAGRRAGHTPGGASRAPTSTAARAASPRVGPDTPRGPSSTIMATPPPDASRDSAVDARMRLLERRLTGVVELAPPMSAPALSEASAGRSPAPSASSRGTEDLDESRSGFDGFAAAVAAVGGAPGAARKRKQPDPGRRSDRSTAGAKAPRRRRSPSPPPGAARATPGATPTKPPEATATLHHYFASLDGASRGSAGGGRPPSADGGHPTKAAARSLALPTPHAPTGWAERETALAGAAARAEARADAASAAEAAARADAAAARADAARARADADAARAAAAAADKDARAARAAADKAAASARSGLARLAASAARADRDLSRERARDATARLGAPRVMRQGALGVSEVWEDGAAARELESRAAALAAARDDVEAARKAVRRRLPPPEHPLSVKNGGGGGGAAANATADGGAATPRVYISPDEYVSRDEAFKARLAALKREEDALARERDRVEADKARHARELRRLADEDASRFGDCPTLAGRYVLGRLLGRGGFSEVYAAADLGAGGASVAVKLHQVAPGWPPARKAAYVRHAMREYAIHRDLVHPRVVSLTDVFEIDDDTFATVLEHCPGGDLDGHLRAHGALPEREARAIAHQILDGLAYLASPPRRVIHYDLKPANILFDAGGGVKITDFGLSKVVEDGATRGLELTSQGAGTYWYLPPECFAAGPAPPRITSKVDVWAVGVMLYQMLFGRRPFGEGRSQEALLRDGVMRDAGEVQFPTRPAASDAAKAFLRACLAPKPDDRLDVADAAAHPYLQLKRGGGKGGGGGA